MIVVHGSIKNGTNSINAPFKSDILILTFMIAGQSMSVKNFWNIVCAFYQQKANVKQVSPKGLWIAFENPVVQRIW